MMELVETVYHWHSGKSYRKVSGSLGISRNTVRKYIGMSLNEEAKACRIR